MKKAPNLKRHLLRLNNYLAAARAALDDAVCSPELDGLGDDALYA